MLSLKRNTFINKIDSVICSGLMSKKQPFNIDQIILNKNIEYAGYIIQIMHAKITLCIILHINNVSKNK